MRAVVAAKRLGLIVAAMGGSAWAGGPETSKPEKSAPTAVGYEIFNREWMPNDSRAHGGDGLGPAFNDTSCVACHNSGGSGGAGPVSKNIDILSASRNTAFMPPPPAPTTQQADPAAAFASATAPVLIGGACPPPTASALEPLIDLHAGFKTSRTVVLHKFGTDPNYEAFRSRFLPNQNPVSPFLGDVTVRNGTANIVMSGIESMTVSDLTFVELANGNGKADAQSTAAQARINQVRAAVAASHVGTGPPINVGPFQVSRSQRSPTPLFGLGLIDSIPESAIRAMAARQRKESPEIAGRPAIVKDGRIGRLGWKGQTANTEDFVLNACAVEVGLEVPGHPQSMTPQAPRYKASGLDLTSEECASLVSYVRSLPRPVEREAMAAEAKYLAAGKALFASIGCAGCHTSKLGEVEGLYSDLLIHDMGQEMADSGSYDGGDDGTDEPLVPLAVAENQPMGLSLPPREPRAARKPEWRTPPLWGFRDSGPYLHDGRAQTLEQAVALHGGQGTASAQKFFLLSSKEKLQVEAFLKSLIAPAAATNREVARAGE